MIAGNCLQNYDLEVYPLKFESIILTDNDFELPGLPIIKIGILLFKQTIVANKFYIRAELRAIFYCAKVKRWI